jgi:hypothetical protein
MAGKRNETPEGARQRAERRSDREYDRAVQRGVADMPTGGFQQPGIEGSHVGDAAGSDPEALSERGLSGQSVEEIAVPFNEDQVVQRIDRKTSHRLVAHLDDDERIREEVIRGLAGDELVDEAEITVRVDGGAVILGGTVESRTIRRRAEDVAEAVRGVAYVQNDIRARHPYFHEADRAAPPGIHTGHDPASAPGLIGDTAYGPTRGGTADAGTLGSEEERGRRRASAPIDEGR